MTTPGDRSMPLTPPSPMEGFDPDAVLGKLTTAEKIDLLSGRDSSIIILFPAVADLGRY
jgi:hypothetical protein